MKASSKWKKMLSGVMGLSVLTAALLTSSPLSTEAAPVESGETYKIQVKSSDMYLEPRGLDAHAQIQQQPGQDKDEQEWIITKVPGNLGDSNDVYNYRDIYTIQNKKTKMYLDVPGYSKSIKERIIQYPYNGGFRNQQWQLIDRGNGYYSIMNFASGLYLDLEGSSRQTLPIFQVLKPLIQYTWNGSENQQFKLIKQQ